MPAVRTPCAVLPSSMSPKLLTLTAVAALVVAATACGTLGKHYGEENESTQVRPTNPVFEPVITTASILVDSVPSGAIIRDRKSTRLNSSHSQQSRMPSSA